MAQQDAVFIIAGNRYPATTLGKATLFEAAELAKTTGLSIGDCEELLGNLPEPEEPEGGWSDEEAEIKARSRAMLASPDHLIAFAALIWISRRRQGEKVSLESSTEGFTLDDLTFETPDAPAPESEPEDPTKAGSSTDESLPAPQDDEPSTTESTPT